MPTFSVGRLERGAFSTPSQKIEEDTYLKLVIDEKLLWLLLQFTAHSEGPICRSSLLEHNCIVLVRSVASSENKRMTETFSECHGPTWPVTSGFGMWSGGCFFRWPCFEFSLTETSVSVHCLCIVRLKSSCFGNVTKEKDLVECLDHLPDEPVNACCPFVDEHH